MVLSELEKMEEKNVPPGEERQKSGKRSMLLECKKGFLPAG